MTSGDARRTAERAARDSYGRLVAILASRTRDVAAAEDALAEAFGRALRAWPVRGVPAKPEAWLLTTARRVLAHATRHGRVRAAAAATLAMLHEEAAAAGQAATPDSRLNLMFVCAHPAIDEAIQAPLMLQVVLGLDAARIATCFLAAPPAMSQRLVRAKAKIRDAGIAFTLPERRDLPSRLDTVLRAVYAAYCTGWNYAFATDARHQGLAEEAIWLARLLVALLPEAPETKGLLALMLHCEARRDARRDPDGRFVPLGRQDTSRWSRAMIDEAETLLHDAARGGTPGRLQVEAAIQSVHAQRACTGATNWPAIVALYALLDRLSPTVGVRVARASAMAGAGDPTASLALLDALGTAASSYQPWWACRARVLTLLGRAGEAGRAYATAAGLSVDPAVRDHLLLQSRLA